MFLTDRENNGTVSSSEAAQWLAWLYSRSLPASQLLPLTSPSRRPGP